MYDLLYTPSFIILRATMYFDICKNKYPVHIQVSPTSRLRNTPSSLSEFDVIFYEPQLATADK